MDPRLSRRHTSALPPPLNSPAHTPRAPRASLNLGPRQNTPGLQRPSAFHSPREVKHSRKSSLLDSKLDPHYVTLKQREDLVRPNAVLALERLLEVGNDAEGGPIRLYQEDNKLFRMFQTAKEVHLSDSTFIAPADLAENPQFTSALSNPTSSLSLIVTVSNLATFLHHILESAPTGPSSSRTPRIAKAAATRLALAAHAFIPLIIPPTALLSNNLLKLLLAIRQQHFLALLEAAPLSPADAQAFWSAPLGDFAAAERLRNRSSARYFGVAQSTALQQVESCGAELEVLRGAWEWDVFVREMVAFANGLAPGVLEQLAETQGPPSSIGEPSQENDQLEDDKAEVEDERKEDDEDEDEDQEEERDEVEDDGRTPRPRRITLSPPISVRSIADSDEEDDDQPTVKDESFEHDATLVEDRSSHDEQDEAAIRAQLVGSTPRAAANGASADGDTQETDQDFNANTQAVTYAHNLHELDDSEDGSEEDHSEGSGGKGNGEEGGDEDDDEDDDNESVSSATTQKTTSEEEDNDQEEEDEQETAPPAETQAINMADALQDVDSDADEDELADQAADDHTDSIYSANTQAPTVALALADMTDSDDDDDHSAAGVDADDPETQPDAETQAATSAAIFAGLESSDSDDDDDVDDEAGPAPNGQQAAPLFAPATDAASDDEVTANDQHRHDTESDATASSPAAVPKRTQPRPTRNERAQPDSDAESVDEAAPVPAPAPSARVRIQPGNRLAKVVEDGAGAGGKAKHRFNATQPGAERVAWESSSPSQERRVRAPPASAPVRVKVKAKATGGRTTRAAGRQPPEPEVEEEVEVRATRRTTRAGSRRAEGAVAAEVERGRGRNAAEAVAEKEDAEDEPEAEVYTSEREEAALGPAENGVEADAFDVHNRDFGGGGDSDEGEEEGVPFGQLSEDELADVRPAEDGEGFELDEEVQASQRPKGTKQKYGKKAARAKERQEARQSASQAVAAQQIQQDRSSASPSPSPTRSASSRAASNASREASLGPGPATAQSRASTQVVQATQDAEQDGDEADDADAADAEAEARLRAEVEKQNAREAARDGSFEASSVSEDSSDPDSDSSEDGAAFAKGLNKNARASKAVPRPSVAAQRRAEKEAQAKKNRRRARRAEASGDEGDRVPEEEREEEERARKKRREEKGKGRAREEEIEEEVDELEEDEPTTPPPRKKPRKQSRTRRAASEEGSDRASPVASTSRARLPSADSDGSFAPRPRNYYFQDRNGPNSRRPWREGETQLLIEELGKWGPDWALIMKRHGPKGYKSRTLRERTNPSIKDKARNLRIEYIRAGEAAPAWLEGIKAPPKWREVEERNERDRQQRARAARERREARERAEGRANGAAEEEGDEEQENGEEEAEAAE